MSEFEEFIRQEREGLSRRRDEIRRQRDDLDRQLQEIEKEFAAVEAYERAKKGQPVTAPASGSKRRTGIRQHVLEIVKRHPDGISRADVLEELHAKGDKRAEQSISNALSNLKKQGQINLDDGVYRAAA